MNYLFFYFVFTLLLSLFSLPLRVSPNANHTQFSLTELRDSLSLSLMASMASLLHRKLQHKPSFLPSFLLLLLLLPIMLIRTYVFHMLRTYVMILCNWLILWQNALYLYLGRLRMCLNTLRNHVSKSSVEAFKSVQEIKQRVKFH